jgi:hypothetical protein
LENEVNICSYLSVILTKEESVSIVEASEIDEIRVPA